MITPDEADAQTVKIEPSGLEKITPAIVDELDAIFEHVAGEVDAQRALLHWMQSNDKPLAAGGLPSADAHYVGKLLADTIQMLRGIDY